MALVVGSAMAGIMLLFMTSMMPSRRRDVVILIARAGVFVVSLWLVRSQVTVDDVSYMRAMIPHHSIAIMTCARANIGDTRVRKLATGIVESQRRGNVRV